MQSPSLAFLQVTVGSLQLRANNMIQQDFQFITEEEKYDRLCKLLEQQMDGSRILAFWPALSIHGDKLQEERDWVLAVRLSTR